MNSKMIGKRIKELRQEQKLTQLHLAKMTNIPKQSIIEIERSSDKYISKNILEKISNALNCNISDITKQNIFYDDINTISSRIRDLRLEKGITQDNLGKRIDVSYDTINNIERGISTITCDKIIKISQVLECDIQYLFGETDIVRVEKKDIDNQNQNKDNITSELYNLLLRADTILNEDKKRILINIIKSYLGI